MSYFHTLVVNSQYLDLTATVSLNATVSICFWSSEIYDLVRQKLACPATETSLNTEISNTEARGIIL